MRALWKLLPLAGLVACSTLVGADFDDLEVAPAPGGAAGSGGSAGKGGGATNNGGEPAAGGTGDGSGGNTTGGTPGAGAGAAGGQNAAGTPGQSEGGAAGTNGDAGAGPVGGSPAGGAGGVLDEPAVVVLNEIKGEGAGDDYIELYNLGPGQKTLTGYKLTDTSNAFIFPSGTVIPEGGYVLLLLGDLLTPGGPFMCFSTNLACFHDNTWGISQNGEDVFFRDPSNQLIETTNYPASIVNGESWGRYPNGSGAFAVAELTPEAENTVP